uniref:Uncharacterized protein n=1 Tax=Paramormyrops kingsleyae TaxID=1676925 RepID=A0A3B3RF72_9TELE
MSRCWGGAHQPNKRKISQRVSGIQEKWQESGDTCPRQTETRFLNDKGGDRKFLLHLRNFPLIFHARHAPPLHSAGLPACTSLPRSPLQLAACSLGFGPVKRTAPK